MELIIKVFLIQKSPVRTLSYSIGVNLHFYSQSYVDHVTKGDVNVTLRKGKEYWKKGKYTSAITAFNNAIPRLYGKKKYNCYMNIARIFKKINNPKLAIENAKEAADVLKNEDEPFSFIAGMYMKQKNFAKAIISYQKAIRKKKKVKYYRHIGFCYYKLKKLQKAISFFKTALRVKRDSMSSYYLGNCYYRLDSIKEALLNYSQAVNVDKNNYKAWINLGNLLRMKKRYSGAMRAFLSAIKVQPDNPLPYYNLGNVYNDQALYKKALEMYEKALKRKPKKKYILKYGEMWARLGKNSNALKEFVKIYFMDPRYSPVHYNLALIYLKMKKNYRAVFHLETYLDLEPQAKEKGQIKKILRRIKK